MTEITTPEMEQWKDVLGYEGLYLISDAGRVRSLPRKSTRGGLLKLQVYKSGYEYVDLYKNGKNKKLRVHRLVLEAFVGACPEGMQCRHWDGNTRQNRLDNLKWGTQSRNCHDKIRHGTDNRGERHPLAKLSDDDVSRIRAMAGTQQEIADLFGVTQPLISKIQLKRIWRHI